MPCAYTRIAKWPFLQNWHRSITIENEPHARINMLVRNRMKINQISVRTNGASKPHFQVPFNR